MFPKSTLFTPSQTFENERSLFDVDIDIGTRGKGIRISQINFYHVISL